MRFLWNWIFIVVMVINLKKASTKSRARVRTTTENNFFHYWPIDKIYEYIDTLPRRHRNLATVQSLEKTYENRTIKMVKISSNRFLNNPVIMIDAGVHAREWVSIALALYVIEQLLTNKRLAKMLKDIDWHIIPLVNPDGYHYSRNFDRLWRKNRSYEEETGCFGVDINRNYDFKWSEEGESDDPCNKYIYSGYEAFCESESRAVKNAMVSYKHRIKVYISLHSYGQLILYPWAYTDDVLPPTWRLLHNLAVKVSKRIQGAGGLGFTVMNTGQLDKFSGGSGDYAYGKLKIPYAYAMELTDGYQFEYPEEKLNKSLPQFFEGFKVFAEHVRQMSRKK